MWKTTTISLMLLITLGSAPVCAQSESDVLNKLAGTEHRVWTFKRFDTILGPGQTCVRGEDADIHANHSVVQRTCTNGKIVQSQTTWTVRNDGIDEWIKIGTEEFELLFTDHDNTMILRKVSSVKTAATIDKVYRRKRD